jgi:hypothetical protein
MRRMLRLVDFPPARILAGASVISLLVSACGDSTSSPPTQPTPQPSTDVTGTWQGTVRSPVTGVTASISLTLTQSGASVTGSFACPFGCIHATGTVSAAVSGTTLTGRVVFSDGHSCNTFDGTVSGQTISGNYACTDPLGNDSGTWSATRGSSTPGPSPGVCSYSLSSTSISITAGGGSSSVTVTASSNCTWTATTNASWITITSGGSGTGNGQVGLSIAANTTASSRSGTLTIAQQTVTITQAAGASSPEPAQLEIRGTYNLEIQVASRCGWPVQLYQLPFIMIYAGKVGNSYFSQESQELGQIYTWYQYGSGAYSDTTLFMIGGRYPIDVNARAVSGVAPTRASDGRPEILNVSLSGDLYLNGQSTYPPCRGTDVGRMSLRVR